MNRHDARGDDGRYRPLSAEEAHAAYVTNLLFGDRTPPPGPPAAGPEPIAPPIGGVLGGGRQGPDAFGHDRAVDADREAFLDGLFPNRPTGARFAPYSTTNPQAPLYRR